MQPCRRSTRVRRAPSTLVQHPPPPPPPAAARPRPRPLPKLSFKERPEPWPPRQSQLPPGMVYHPPAPVPKAKPPPAPKAAPQDSVWGDRQSSEETLAGTDDTASDTTLSAPGSPIAPDQWTAFENVEDEGRAFGPNTPAHMVRLWDRRRRDAERMVCRRGEPECEFPVSAVRSTIPTRNCSERQRRVAVARMNSRRRVLTVQEMCCGSE
ncbi:hypothetical protein C7974DRAFT_175138 [Boeremia exigua]|uniref:uncharacterized protein n=1 Tax=Boeremia exigua TaxID=749465 RepID=UPI001E8DF350|nr:uncharacterized protein C7974DRAFT_175138 [Boeremia exigua]KAH6633597.1 hypothetical protein C7974DRAFT_175138 [Boeremia exigua]